MSNTCTQCLDLVRFWANGQVINQYAGLLDFVGKTILHQE